MASEAGVDPANALLAYGTEQQKREYLPRIAR
jgi:alkylation response protein AidB-like acyl-CoA dehydrogenase